MKIRVPWTVPWLLFRTGEVVEGGADNVLTNLIFVQFKINFTDRPRTESLCAET
jgi:hypothetical protein